MELGIPLLFILFTVVVSYIAGYRSGKHEAIDDLFIKGDITYDVYKKLKQK